MQGMDDPSGGLYEDEETRALYESMPDLRAIVPAKFLGEASEESGAGEESEAEPAEASTAIADAGADAGASGVHAAAAETDSTGAAAAAGKPKSEFELLLARLPECVNRERCDQLAVDFCWSTAHRRRKRLVRPQTTMDKQRSSLGVGGGGGVLLK